MKVSLITSNLRIVEGKNPGGGVTYSVIVEGKYLPTSPYLTKQEIWRKTIYRRKLWKYILV